MPAGWARWGGKRDVVLTSTTMMSSTTMAGAASRAVSSGEHSVGGQAPSRPHRPWGRLLLIGRRFRLNGPWGRFLPLLGHAAVRPGGHGPHPMGASVSGYFPQGLPANAQGLPPALEALSFVPWEFCFPPCCGHGQRLGQAGAGAHSGSSCAKRRCDAARLEAKKRGAAGRRPTGSTGRQPGGRASGRASAARAAAGAGPIRRYISVLFALPRFPWVSV